MQRRVMITGGLGFIGGNLCNYWMDHYPEDQIVCLDSMTYAAEPGHVLAKASKLGKINQGFVHVYGDIADKRETRRFVQLFRPDHIIHLAAESHVCRSIDGPTAFFETNVMGTLNLLEAAREVWEKDISQHRFYHVSTDEVYGVAWGNSEFNEDTKYRPRSPYAASKAASDHLVMSYHHTYGMNTVISNCSNNFGPSQHIEKLIPKTIESILKGKQVRIYGTGKQVRDWLWVEDHCSAIDTIFHKGGMGQQYVVGGRNELTNLQVVDAVAECVRSLFGEKISYTAAHTNDRPTDDQRYAVDPFRLEALGWKANKEDFMENLAKTVVWYANQLGMVKG